MNLAQVKILAVDDVPSMRSIIHDILLAIGFEDITLAENGNDALMKVQKQAQSGAHFDLILCDWTMPIVSGIEFLRQIRTNDQYRGHKKVPFIMVTTESEQQKIIQALSLGISNYIFKPVTAEVLQKKAFAALNIVTNEISKMTEEKTQELDKKALAALGKQKKIEKEG